MPVVTCICGSMQYVVIRPSNPQKWGTSLPSQVFGDVPEPRDDEMPILICHRCGRWSWADGKVADPEGRLSP